MGKVTGLLSIDFSPSAKYRLTQMQVSQLNSHSGSLTVCGYISSGTEKPPTNGDMHILTSYIQARDPAQCIQFCIILS